MSELRYLAGLGAVLLALGASWQIAWLVRRRLCPQLTGPPAALAVGVGTVAVLLLVAQLLGVLGLLTPAALMTCYALLGLAGLVLRRTGAAAVAAAGTRPRGPAGDVATVGRPDRFVVVAGAGLLGLLLAQWLAWVADRLGGGIRSLDTLTYHLPYGAYMAQHGRTYDLPYIIADQPTPFYALNTELLHALGMIAFGSEFGSAFLNLALLAILLLAAFSAGLRAGPTTGWLAMALAAGAMTAPLMAATQPGAANSDLGAVAFIVAAIALLAHAPLVGREADRPGATLPVLFLAALATGVAISVKISVLPMAALLTGAALIAFRRCGVGRVALVWAAGVLLTGAFWYLQNLVRIGNPVPFVNVRLGPVELPAPDWSGLAPLSASVSDYLTEPQAWGFFRDGLALALGRGWPILLGLGLTGILAGLVSRDRFVRMLALVATCAVIAYLYTPYTAGGFAGQPVFFAPGLRFLFPALLAGLLLLPLAVLSARPLPRRVVVALALAYVLMQFVPVRPAVDLFAFIRAWPDGSVLIPVVLAVVVALLVLVTGLARDTRRISRPLLGTAAGVLLLAGVLGGADVQRHYVQARNDTGYSQDGGTLFAAVDPIYRAVRGVAGSRIGYSGMQEVHPFIGPRLSNSVVFLGQGTRNGGMTNAATCQAWLAAVRAERVDRVVVFAGAGGSTDVFGGPQLNQITWTSRIPGAVELVRSATPPGPYGPGLLTVLFRLNPAQLDRARC